MKKMQSKKQNTKKPRWKKKGYENISQAIDDKNYKFEEWSEDLIKELNHLFKNGYSTKQLSILTGLKEWGIRDRLNLKTKKENISLGVK